MPQPNAINKPSVEQIEAIRSQLVQGCLSTEAFLNFCSDKVEVYEFQQMWTRRMLPNLTEALRHIESVREAEESLRRILRQVNGPSRRKMPLISSKLQFQQVKV